MATTLSRAADMIAALMATQDDRTPARLAGGLLAEAGWAVFPLPAGRKYDDGRGALIYRDATRDSAIWDTLMLRLVRRGLAPEDDQGAAVNIGLSPWACAEPLVVLDLDGPTAVAAFTDNDLAGGCFRVETAGKGGGRHIYVAGAKTPRSGTHRWGGEVRSDRGHVLLPGSVIDGNPYIASGAYFAKIDLAGIGRTCRGAAAGPLALGDLDWVVERLSLQPPTPGARRQLDRHLRNIRGARGSRGRHPAAMSAVASAVAMAEMGILPLRWALDEITLVMAEARAGETPRCRR